MRSELTWDDFYQELRGTIEAIDYRPDELHPLTNSYVFVAPLSSRAGVRYRAVALLGLSEGIFPHRSIRTRFCPTKNARDCAGTEYNLSRAHGAINSRSFTRRSRERMIICSLRDPTSPTTASHGSLHRTGMKFARLLQRALRVRADAVPTRPGPDSHTDQPYDGAQPPEPAAEYRPQSEWTALRRSASILQARLAHEPLGEFEGQMPELCETIAERYSPAHIWSASRLEAYSTCPFRFYIENVLTLRRPSRRKLATTQLNWAACCTKFWTRFIAAPTTRATSNQLSVTFPLLRDRFSMPRQQSMAFVRPCCGTRSVLSTRRKA